MWEIELSYDLLLNSRAKPRVKAERIDTLEAETLSDAVEMMRDYISFENYTVEGMDGHRLYLRYGAALVRLTMYHEYFREKSPEHAASMRALKALILARGAKDAVV